MKKTMNYITLEFLSRSSNEAFARTAVACFAAQMDPTLGELEDIKTAVSEAVTNAIVHGYPNVKDRGRGIPDVEKARQPMFTTGGEERSGMGFTIMESFMDHIAVKSVPGKGTTVTLRKKLAPRRRQTA